MKHKNRKKKQLDYAQWNIERYFSLLKKRFRPEFDAIYVREIKRLSEGFNIRLTQQQKLLFCRKCLCFWDNSTRQIRMNSKLKAKEYICKKCDYVKRFKYK